jgi:hypothetical protein
MEIIFLILFFCILIGICWFIRVPEIPEDPTAKKDDYEM